MGKEKRSWWRELQVQRPCGRENMADARASRGWGGLSTQCRNGSGESAGVSLDWALLALLRPWKGLVFVLVCTGNLMCWCALGIPEREMW